MLSWVLCALLWQAPDAKKLFADGIEAANRGELSKAKELFLDLGKRLPGAEESLKASLWTQESPLLSFRALAKSGPPSRRIDIVALAEAFKATPGDQRLFLRDAEKGFGLIFDGEVFREYRDYFNTFAAGIGAKDSRVDQFNRKYDTPLDGVKNGDISQVVVSPEKVRLYLSGLPYQDGLAYVVVQDEGTGSGGSGLAVLPGEPQREPIMRVFGFGFGALAEESSSSSYQSAGRPAESVNVSTSSDPKLVPWAHWIKAIPERVSVYEGGAGAFKGVYRPTADGCVMRGGREFCVVCREALVLEIYRRVSPVDDATPGDAPITMDRALKTAREIFVQVKEPKSHQIQVKFFYAPLAGGKTLPPVLSWKAVPDDDANPERVSLAKEPPADWQEVAATRKHEGGAPREVLDLKKLLRAEKAPPGRYGVVALVTDACTVKGEKWVLKDLNQRLKELLGWEVIITGE